MPTLRIPTPLRPYTEGQAELTIQGSTVSQALDDLISRYPALKQHLFNGQGELRPFVNLFLNTEDVRHLDGQETSLKEEDRLMIIPSIAGGRPGGRPDNQPGGLKRVDHAALRTNQAGIIALSLLAYILNWPWLAALVALAMALGTALGAPGFGFIYQRWLKPWGWVKPAVLADNPEPHRFAQGFGAGVLLAGVAALQLGAGNLGWALVWLVIFLAALNLFVGFCAGCAVYYWLNRLNIPGFTKPAPQGTFPGMRPQAKAEEHG